MKTIRYTRLFLKHYKLRIRVNKKLEKQVMERIDLFLHDKNNPQLRDHQLKGEMKDFRSFSITGDIRIIYSELDGIYEFFDIGSHNQLYNG